MKIIQDVDKAINVMREVGEWMEKSGLNPSRWWQSRNMSREFLLQYTEPEEFYVALEGDKSAASVVLQDSERNQSWKSVDGEVPQKALYVHWLCVSRAFAGRGFSRAMLDFAAQEAKKRGFKLLRLDTDAEEKKLRDLYENANFRLVGIEKNEGHTTVFYQKEIP